MLAYVSNRSKILIKTSSNNTSTIFPREHLGRLLKSQPSRGGDHLRGAHLQTCFFGRLSFDFLDIQTQFFAIVMGRHINATYEEEIGNTRKGNQSENHMKMERLPGADLGGCERRLSDSQISSTIFIRYTFST